MLLVSQDDCSSSLQARGFLQTVASLQARGFLHTEFRVTPPWVVIAFEAYVCAAFAAFAIAPWVVIAVDASMICVFAAFAAFAIVLAAFAIVLAAFAMVRGVAIGLVDAISTTARTKAFAIALAIALSAFAIALAAIAAQEARGRPKKTIAWII